MGYLPSLRILCSFPSCFGQFFELKMVEIRSFSILFGRILVDLDQMCSGQFWAILMPWIYWAFNEDEKPSRIVTFGSRRWLFQMGHEVGYNHVWIGSWVFSSGVEDDLDDKSFCFVVMIQQGGKRHVIFAQWWATKTTCRIVRAEFFLKKKGFLGSWERVWAPILANFFPFAPNCLFYQFTW